MPDPTSNYVGYRDGGAGLRYRDIENSNWRGELRSHGGEYLGDEPTIEPKTEASRKYDDIPKYTFEKFTGTEFQEMERRPADCMSVMLKVDEGEMHLNMDSHKKRVRFGKSNNKGPVTLDAYLNIGDEKKTIQAVGLGRDLK
ncbi:hypothetical protein K3495_g2319 [Podosphaera aphanis]|nr:hypothetical protein K3495_g2319 [Podosphaera aphanis]